MCRDAWTHLQSQPSNIHDTPKMIRTSSPSIGNYTHHYTFQRLTFVLAFLNHQCVQKFKLHMHWIWGEVGNKERGRTTMSVLLWKRALKKTAAGTTASFFTHLPPALLQGSSLPMIWQWSGHFSPVISLRSGYFLGLVDNPQQVGKFNHLTCCAWWFWLDS